MKKKKAGIEVEAVIGDGAYSEKDNLEYCKEHGIENISRLSNMIVMGNSKNVKALNIIKMHKCLYVRQDICLLKKVIQMEISTIIIVKLIHIFLMWKNARDAH